LTSHHFAVSENGVPVLIDGFIVSVAALAAARINRRVVPCDDILAPIAERRPCVGA